ncbi:da15c394-ba21-49a8-9794-297ea90a932c [Thermothielavioides terrestris]|uniref:Da15c394-ba21-49a8-9794-297ea90a932c n=1 Tax=Thermothielavioides terrestris TaxID=2587410 RepID=A0A3S4D6H0_9PEZI|nr:da15c394-ba21-49a8-9794-297ea90a932c [Thermothielavioides terrestris]
MPSATPQPQLKKKASFRDRLKAWQKPPQPLEVLAEESKPRFVYEPKHAAADFSRLAVSPLSPTRQRLPAAMWPVEDDTVEATGRIPQRRDSTPRVRRHSYALAEEPFHAANGAAHVPVASRPVAWSPAADRAAQGGHDQTSQPLSDYELFIARAEAEDRERRERVLRSISQRSPPSVRPDPHRQFATAAGSSSVDRSSGTSNSRSRFVLSGGSADTPTAQPHQPQQQHHRGHGRRSSWDPEYVTTGASVGAEKVSEKTRSSPAPQPQQRPQRQAQPRRLPEPAQNLGQPAVYGVGADFGNTSPPPRTLRRQASLTKRIAEYIRPPKTAMRQIETLVE